MRAILPLLMMTLILLSCSDGAAREAERIWGGLNTGEQTGVCDQWNGDRAVVASSIRAQVTPEVAEALFDILAVQCTRFGVPTTTTSL